MTLEVIPLLQLVPEFHGDAKMCAKSPKELERSVSLEEPATKYGRDGSVGVVIGGEAERTVVDNVDLGVKEIRV